MVRPAGDELIHYAGAQATPTLGCAQLIIPELSQTDEQTGEPAGEEPRRPCRCRPVEWVAAIGRIRLVPRPPTFLLPNPTSQTAVTDHSRGAR